MVQMYHFYDTEMLASQHALLLQSLLLFSLAATAEGNKVRKGWTQEWSLGEHR